MAEYISDVITEENIDSWKQGDRILISSQTGSGKSEFIKNKLYNYCGQRGKRILLLSNRNLLKRQNLYEINDKGDTIAARNYQSLESHYLDGEELDKLFSGFDYIIYDEAHYFFADSQFNRNTDILLDPIINTPNDKVFIFLTATPQVLLRYQPNFQYVYNPEHDYSYIKDVYFFNSDDTINLILEKLPPEEKLIYFASDALDSYTLAMQTPNAKFICSEAHRELSKKSNAQTMNEIAEKRQFSCQSLFCTKVLDNGVNLVDPALLHIVIDMLDPISFIQCLGRKRIVGNEKITLYVKNYYYLSPLLRLILPKLKLVEELRDMGKEAFQKKYKRKDLDNLILNDGTINEAKLIQLKFLKSNIMQILSSNDYPGYKKLICDLIDFPIEETKNAERHYEKQKLEKEIKEWLGIKLYKEEQERFKQIIFTCLFSPKNRNYRKLGYNSFNSIMNDNGLPYEIKSTRDRTTRDDRRDQYYWEINIKPK